MGENLVKEKTTRLKLKTKSEFKCIYIFLCILKLESFLILVVITVCRLIIGQVFFKFYLNKLCKQNLVCSLCKVWVDFDFYRINSSKLKTSKNIIKQLKGNNKKTKRKPQTIEKSLDTESLDCSTLIKPAGGGNERRRRSGLNRKLSYC